MRPIQFSFYIVLIKSTQLPEVPEKDYKEKFSKGDNKWITYTQDTLPTPIWSFLPVKMSRLSSVIPTNQNHNDGELFNFSRLGDREVQCRSLHHIPVLCFYPHVFA
jgi:hypothetical protein